MYTFHILKSVRLHTFPKRGPRDCYTNSIRSYTSLGNLYITKSHKKTLD